MPDEDRALVAAAMEIVHTIIYGTIHTSEEQAVVAIMRRHGLRGPEPEGSVGSLNEFKRAYLPETAKREEEERARTTTEVEP